MFFTRKTESRHREGEESGEPENKTLTAVASDVTQDSSSPSTGSCWQRPGASCQGSHGAHKHTAYCQIAVTISGKCLEAED